MTNIKLTTPTLKPLLTYMPNSNVERYAEKLADHIATLLSTDVVITEINQLIIASNKRSLVGKQFDPQSIDQPNNDYWVPLTIEDHVVKIVASQPSNGEVLSSRLLKKLVEMVYTQISTEAQPTSQELKDNFVRKLLNGQLADPDLLSQRAAMAGIDLRQPYHILLVDASEVILGGYDHPAADDQVRRRAQTVINHVVNIFGPVSQSVCSYIGNGEVVVLRPCAVVPPRGRARQSLAVPSSQAIWNDESTLAVAETVLQRLHEQVDPSVRVGIGRYYPGPTGLSRSYNEARTVIELGRRVNKQPGIDTLEHIGIAAFVGLADDQVKRDVALRCLAPLETDPELLKTVVAFFANDCCPSSTARQLSIHRNTLSYRLDKITTITGMDPRKFDDAVQLRLALFVRDLYDRKVKDAATRVATS